MEEGKYERSKGGRKWAKGEKGERERRERGME